MFLHIMKSEIFRATDEEDLIQLPNLPKLKYRQPDN